MTWSLDVLPLIVSLNFQFHLIISRVSKLKSKMVDNCSNRGSDWRKPAFRLLWKIHQPLLLRKLIRFLLLINKLKRCNVYDSPWYCCWTSFSFQCRSEAPHWDAFKSIFISFLFGTIRHDLFTGPDLANKCMGFYFSDYARCPDTRKSTTGMSFIINGGPISWKSRIQKSVACSSMEA